MTNFPNTRLWFTTEDDVPSEFDFCGGKVMGFSRNSPIKTSGNEDAASIVELSPDHGLIIVADGMGGANAGDRAAKCVVETIVNFLEAGDFDDETTRPQILDAIETANQEVLSWGLGAGSTVVVVEYRKGQLRMIHVGDATGLVCSNRGRVKFSTVAHSPVAMAFELGVLDETEALNHEDRHLITNCVGSTEMKIELGPRLSMAPRDTLVVASDGLFDNLTTDEIVNTVRAGQLSLQTGLLLDLVRDRMSCSDESLPSKPDDVTVFCFRQ